MSSEKTQRNGNNLRAAAAVVNITPAVGCAMAGYGARNQYADEVADELYSKVLVVESAGARAAIVTNDLIGVPQALTDRIRESVRQAAGIAPENVLVCASHTHFGPVVDDEDYPAENIDWRADAAWLDLTVRKLAGAAAIAVRQLTPARVGLGTALAGHLCYNRRTIRPDGKVEMSWRLPPSGAQFTFGPKDPEVGILKIENEAGKLLATLVNFGCHAVCGGENLYALSADFPGYAMKLIERERGGICLFTAGGAGNVVPLERGATSRRRIGEALGAAVLSVLDFITPVSAETIKTLSKPLPLPLKPLPPLEEASRVVEEARRQLAEKPGKAAEEVVGRAKLALRQAKRFDRLKELACKVQAIRVGDLAIIGLPGEIFCETVMSIKKDLPAGKVMVVSIANDCPAYVPNRIAYDQGGYEPEYTPIAPGGDAVVQNVAVRLGQEILERA
jgi:hypothetical protein